MRLSLLGSLVGVLTFGAVSVSSALAGGQASISGSVTFITPANFTSTVSSESVLPPGFNFTTGAGVLTNPVAPNLPTTLTNAQVIVVPAYNVLGFSVASTSVSVGSTVAPAAGAISTSFSAAAATVLTNSAAATAQGLPAFQAANGRTTGPVATITYASGNIDFISAIIKAGAGVNGLD